MVSSIEKDNYILETKGSRNDELFYDFKTVDGLVTGLVGISGHVLAIYEWRSLTARKGNTNSALRSLRKSYQTLEVKDIGADSNDSSWQYWLHIRAKGLVERLYDGMNELIP